MIGNIKVRKLAMNSMFVSIGIILATISNFRIPFFSFFKLDFSDIPVFVSTLMFGGLNGFANLFVISIIRLFTGDTVSIMTFLMRMSSSIIILFLHIYRKKQKYFFIFSIASVILLVIIRLPLSYYFWVCFRHVPEDVFFSQMRITIITLIFTRAVLNLSIAKMIFCRII